MNRAAEVMQWYDRECDAEQQRHVRLLLAHSEDARRQLASLEALGDWVRHDFERRTQHLPDYTDCILASVERRVASAEPDRSGVRPIAWLELVALAEHAPDRGQGRNGARAASFAAQLRTIRVRAFWWHSAFCAVTIAAAIVLSIVGHRAAPASGMSGRTPAGVETDRAAFGSARAASGSGAAAVRAGARVERVDFGDLRGAIYMVRGAENNTPVIWLTESASASSARM